VPHEVITSIIDADSAIDRDRAIALAMPGRPSEDLTAVAPLAVSHLSGETAKLARQYSVDRRIED